MANGANYPGTSTPVTHSYESRLMIAEFDDALLDQASWKNSRYDGSKLTAAKIGEFNVGDTSYQNLPLMPYTSTALYIANTVVGGTEDPQYATIKNHSYIGINKILLINPDQETVQILDQKSDPYEEFHRFITNDFPTGKKCKIKVIDESISTNLKGLHRVKMNKGYLLKTFEFKHGGEASGSADHMNKVLLENNSIYLYKSGSLKDNYITSHSAVGQLFPGGTTASLSDTLRLRYGVVEMFSTNTAGKGAHLGASRLGPSFASSSIIENKFTRQYYSGSYGNIIHQPDTDTNTMAKFMATTGLGSASRFIGIDTLGFLNTNNSDTTLLEQEKTELHVTFFEGTKNFDLSGSFDERSIGTFEVDQNIAALGSEQAGLCNDGLPTNHEITFKGRGDGRFMPTINTFSEDFISAHAAALDAGTGIDLDSNGCTPLNTLVHSAGGGGSGADVGPPQYIQQGINVDRIDNIDCYVQGGALGEIGYDSVYSASIGSAYADSQLDSMTTENFYSGSFRYDISFLDKDHTLVIDLDKEEELVNGIGNLGLLIIPKDIDPQVAFNIEYYLEKAGILTSTSATKQQISRNTNNQT